MNESDFVVFRVKVQMGRDFFLTVIWGTVFISSEIVQPTVMTRRI